MSLEALFLLTSDLYPLTTLQSYLIYPIVAMFWRIPVFELQFAGALMFISVRVSLGKRCRLAPSVRRPANNSNKPYRLIFDVHRVAGGDSRSFNYLRKVWLESTFQILCDQNRSYSQPCCNRASIVL